jgi:hypothetical protein
VLAHTNYVLYTGGGATPLAATAAPQGYTPTQIRHAYGFDQISGPADGSGTTIAIVDAYDDPNIAGDLQQFDAAFHLPDPVFNKYDQNGGTNYPGPNAGWIREIALDVEWAHAIAPGATIDLFEANSAAQSDLFTAIQTAASAPGVNVVSMSFGFAEFKGENASDSLFVHTGITFLASSGDSGAPPSYPAISPNVVSVGGTTLNLDSSGNYISETGWSGSGGGLSKDTTAQGYESQPSYQNGVVTQSTTLRANPDVSYDADPNTGFPIYDSYNNGTTTPWDQVGGTSDAAPQWAGLIAIADQGRILDGLSPLSGNTQTLPDIYAMPASNFHDITSGTSTGNPHYTAGPGYDLVTGIGTPVANLVVNDLVGAHFNVSAPASTTAGYSFSITVTAINGAGTTNTGYTGTVHFTSTDGAASLPADYTFQPGDNGVHSFNVTLFTPGMQKIKVTDTSNNNLGGSAKIQVNLPVVAGFQVTAPSSATAGTAFPITVAALDTMGNLDPYYTGTVHFSSSDNMAILPADAAFTSADMGAKNLIVTLETAGSRSITATDTQSVTGSATVTVMPSSLFQFSVTGPALTLPGAAFSVTVTAQDRYGNTITDFSDSVRFSSTDTAAALPSAFPFDSSMSGSHTFANAITLQSIGFQTITATDTTDSAVTGSGTVNVFAAFHPLGAHNLITGAGAGGLPLVNVYDAGTGALEVSFMPYDSRFQGGVRVALGDVNGDGVPDIITGPGPSGGPDVRVFDGATGKMLYEFNAYDSRFLNGIYVAAGNITSSQHADIITGPDAGGGPDVRVFDGQTHALQFQFMAYDSKFLGGVRVAAADVNGDGVPDIITGAGPGGGPHVEVFSGANYSVRLQSFYAFDSTFSGGVYVAGGDLNGGANADVITSPGAGGEPQVRIYSGVTNGLMLQSFDAYDSRFTGGVQVATLFDPVTGQTEIVTGAGPGGGPHTKVIDPGTLNALDSFYAYNSSFAGGVMVGGL